MELTKAFIEQQFNVINEKFFEGKLLTPTFEIKHVKSYLGQYHWRYSYDSRIFIENVIRISDMFDRTEKDIINTIAHEMIHLYIRQNKIKDTNKHHGKVFYSIAERLNREGGFHIARTDSVEGCGLRDKSTAKEYIVAAFYSGRSGHHFKFAINPKYLDYYLEKFEMYPTHYKNVIVFKTSDDKAYANLPQCYKGVRGQYITQEEYDLMKQNENIIHQYQTLGIAA
jgi:hypothetical protein